VQHFAGGTAAPAMRDRLQRGDFEIDYNTAIAHVGDAINSPVNFHARAPAPAPVDIRGASRAERRRAEPEERKAGTHRAAPPPSIEGSMERLGSSLFKPLFFLINLA
jgi:hypothetical protein